MNPKRKSILSRIFALSGTVLLWAPIAFMFLSAIIAGIGSGQFLFDYLMLAEFFPIAALGMVLLILAGIFSRSFVRWFAWGTGAAFVSLAGGQILAVTSGLASGTASRSGLAFGVVIASILLYNLIVIALAILGVALVKKLFRKENTPQPAESC